MDLQEPSTSTNIFAEAFSNAPEIILHRRNIRKLIRKNIQDVKQNQEQYKHDVTSINLLKKIEEENKLYQQIRHPREAVCDAEFLSCVANVGRERARYIPVNLVQFRPVAYAEKLANLIRGDRLPLTVSNDDEPIFREEWASFGQKCLKYFKRVPTFHYMFGSFDRGEIIVKQRTARVIRKDVDMPANAVAPKEMSDSSKKKAQESTTEEIERVFGHLRKVYEDYNRKACCLFKFVVNPNSFSLTVQNIFHVSFLIRDKYARIYLDENGLPVIEPIKRGRESSSRQNKSKQMIIDMTFEKWKQLVKTFKIVEPLIPPRSR